MLKEEGHVLIDRLARLGIPRRHSYAQLGELMGISPFHFAEQNDEDILRRAVRTLHTMVWQRQMILQRRIAKPRRQKYAEVFTDKRVLQAVGRRNRRRMFWGRVFSLFTFS